MNRWRDRNLPAGHDSDAFVDGVMGRTSGSACGRALDQLDALLEDRLEGLDRQLVQGHLEHCPGCCAVAVTLGWLGPLLPQMAEMDPGPAFTAAVLGRTTRRRQSHAAPATPRGAAGLMDRVGRWWDERILRPTFATEVAYVATVLLVLATATPWSPWRDAPAKALQVATAGPTALPVVGAALESVTDWTERESSDLVAGGRERLVEKRRSLNGELQARAARSAADRAALGSHLETMADRARAGELSEAGHELLAALHSSRAAWDTWWHASENEPTDTPSGP